MNNCAFFIERKQTPFNRLRTESERADKRKHKIWISNALSQCNRCWLGAYTFCMQTVQLHRPQKWFIIENNWYLLSFCGSLPQPASLPARRRRERRGHREKEKKRQRILVFGFFVVWLWKSRDEPLAHEVVDENRIHRKIVMIINRSACDSQTNVFVVNAPQGIYLNVEEKQKKSSSPPLRRFFSFLG